MSLAQLLMGPLDIQSAGRRHLTLTGHRIPLKLHLGELRDPVDGCPNYLRLECIDCEWLCVHWPSP